MADVEIHETAATLWPQFIARAGLTGRRSERQGAYDRDLIDALREQLFPGSTAPIEDLIVASDLSAEALVRAFFATLKPFAEMKSDILALLSAAGARASGDSLSLRFDFDPDGEPLDLLFEDFRRQMERLAEVLVPTAPAIDYGALWSLPRAGGVDSYRYASSSDAMATPSLRGWLSRYATGAFELLPADWLTGRLDLDERLQRVAALADGYLAAFRRHGRDHEDLRRAGYAEAGDERDPSGMTVRELWILESDFWPRAIVQWIIAIRTEHQSGNEAVLDAAIAEVDRILPPGSYAPSKSIVKTLEDILELPVWKQRHEVYAVWLGAQVFQALEAQGWNFHFHLNDNRLEFAFRGVHLATLVHSSRPEVLFWWTELETAHEGLPSGHRTRGIKPDYRVRKAPLSEPSPDVLVVEAKQHLRSSTREFVDALVDYAFACPGAVVFLANYGPVSTGVGKQLSAPVRARSAGYADMHPGEPERLAGFRANLGRSLITALEGEPQIFADRGIEVRLTWGHRPADLDLHVMSEDNGDIKVGYDRLQAGGLRYERDVTDGKGPEVVHITASSGVFRVRVHRYSADGELSSSEAEIEVLFKDDLARRGVKFRAPAALQGDWWEAVRIDADQMTAEAIGT